MFVTTLHSPSDESRAAFTLSATEKEKKKKH